MISLFRKIRLDYYKSIDDMPIYNWLKIQESNNLTWMLKTKSEISKSKSLKILEAALNNLTDEYIDTFGVSEDYKKILRLRGEIRSKEIDFLIDGNKVNKTFIELKKAELRVAMEQINKNDYTSIHVHVRKYMGQPINMRETSVLEYYGILKELQKESKQNER